MNRFARWPILTRVLAVMLAGVLAVQVANFVLLQLVPLPTPSAYGLPEVAAALQANHESEDTGLSRTVADRPDEDGRSSQMVRALARELNAPVESVRLIIREASLPQIISRQLVPSRGNPTFERTPLLLGDFSASWQRPEGGWSIVKPSQSAESIWRMRLVLWLLLALVTVVPFAWLLARWVVRPVAAFAAAADRIGRNLHAAPMAVEGPAEIAHAAEAFNKMQARLNRYVDDRTLVVGAIAHDLRTPLMRMALRLDGALESERPALLRDIAEMKALIAAATSYVREASEVRTRRPLDLRSLAHSVVDDYADRGQSVVLTAGDPVVVLGDTFGLKSMLDNLLTNALRYAGAAEVGMEALGGYVRLEVRDRGPGVPPEHLERVFEPFFRGEPSRNRDTGGIGLGLASVRSVARAHGGDVAAANRAGGGLIVTVTLPQ